MVIKKQMFCLLYCQRERGTEGGRERGKREKGGYSVVKKVISLLYKVVIDMCVYGTCTLAAISHSNNNRDDDNNDQKIAREPNWVIITGKRTTRY